MAQNQTTKAAGVSKITSRPKMPSSASVKASKEVSRDSKPSNRGRKRKGEEETLIAAQTKKPRVAKAKTSTKEAAGQSSPPINKTPDQPLNVYVFGEGSNAELGLGPEKTSIDVKRPRLNPKLKADEVGVVALSCGGMHTLAVTQDGAVYSWGVNDNGALGRDTKWEGGLRDMDDEDSSDSEDGDSGMNPLESTPAKVDFPPNTKIVQVSAGDSISLALTDDGQVYGWGCFRNQNGIMGFYQKLFPMSSRRGPKPADSFTFVQHTPTPYAELKKIVSIATGSNHAMALSQSGEVFIWGCGEQSQLGHHINERHDVEGKASLVPSPLRTGRRKYKGIFSGNDHCFAIDTKGQVWSWGLNSFGQSGLRAGAGGNGATVFVPTVIKSLSNLDDPVKMLCGGQHHSLAVTEGGRCLAFGRLDGLQLGLDTKTLKKDDLIFDDHEPPRPRILIEPQPIPNLGSVVYAASGVDHSIVINTAGQAFSWGISVTYQTGLGTTNDVEYPTRIENTAVRDKKLTWVGCGGQFSVLAGPAAATAPMVNGDVKMGNT